jgi:CelD/BcsL family acetyltransferase involved in cellulose biosynthesis
VEVEVHTNLHVVAAEWDELAGRVQALPWIRRGWIQAWLDAFGTGSAQVFLVRDEAGAAAVLPLIRRGQALRSPANWHTPAFSPVAESDAAARALAAAVFTQGLRRIEFRFLPAEFTALEAVREEARRAGYRVVTRVLMRSPYVLVDGTWDEYESRLSRNHRGDIRRRRRRLEEEGNLAITQEDGSEDLEGLLAEGFRIEASGWKGSHGTAILSSPATRRFYSSVARWAREEGWLRLAFLRLDGRPLAFHLDLEADGVLYHLKGGYDPAFEQYSPGKVLHHEMLARAFAAGLARYEFLGGDEPYKLSWADDVHERLLVQAFAGSLAGVAERAAFQYARPLAKQVLSRIRSPG